MEFFKEDFATDGEYCATLQVVATDGGTNYILTYLIDSAPNKEYWLIRPKQRMYDLVGAQLGPAGQLKRCPRHTANYPKTPIQGNFPKKIALQEWRNMPSLPDVDKDNTRVRNFRSPLDSADYGY